MSPADSTATRVQAMLYAWLRLAVYGYVWLRHKALWLRQLASTYGYVHGASSRQRQQDAHCCRRTVNTAHSHSELFFAWKWSPNHFSIQTHRHSHRRDRGGETQTRDLTHGTRPPHDAPGGRGCHGHGPCGSRGGTTSIKKLLLYLSRAARARVWRTSASFIIAS